jgi:hypothetical protein
VRTTDAVETYHDRIRESVLPDAGSESWRRGHLRVACALEEHGPSEPHVLFPHFEAAGESARAAHYAELAAEAADRTLALDRAAELYDKALRLGEHAPGDRARLLVKLAEARGRAGRGGGAAAAYLDAALLGNASERVDRRGRAAEHLILSGRIDEGLSVLAGVVTEAGATFPSSQRGALVSILGTRAKIRWQELASRTRDRTGELARFELFRSIAAGLGPVDPIRAAYFQERALLCALRSGDEQGIARALSLEAVYRAMPGCAERERVERMFDRVRALLPRIDDPYVPLFLETTRQIAYFFLGMPRAAADAIPPVEAGLAEIGRASTWERTMLRFIRASALRQLGSWPELVRVVDEYARDDIERDNRFLATSVTRLVNQRHLLDDDPRAAEAALRAAVWPTPPGTAHVQTVFELWAVGDRWIYEGRADRRRALAPDLAVLRRSQLLRMQVLRLEVRSVRARLALAHATSLRGLARRAALREVRRHAKLLERELTTHALVYTALLRAGLAAIERDEPRSIAELRRAIDLCGDDLAFHAAVARRQLGTTLGGDRGRQLVGEADATLRANGARRPERVAALFAPGF